MAQNKLIYSSHAPVAAVPLAAIRSRHAVGLPDSSSAIYSV